MKKTGFYFLIFVLCVNLNIAQESLDNLLWNEEVMVVTASKNLQNLTESPSSITVITEEDIARSGALTIPDLLRRVAGIDVMQTTSNSFNVSIRGFNELWPHRLLVLVDGRTQYCDFYGSISWNALNCIMPEIKQIEVIRGPGSALYGANAYLGTINIITKKPENLPFYSASFSIGNYDTYSVTGISANIFKQWSYKFTFERTVLGRFKEEKMNYHEVTQRTLEAELFHFQQEVEEYSQTTGITIEEAFRNLFFSVFDEYPSSDYTFYEYLEYAKTSEEYYNRIYESPFFQDTIFKTIDHYNQVFADREGGENLKFNSQFEYFPNSNLNLKLQAGYAESKTEEVTSHQPFKYLLEDIRPYLRFDIDLYSIFFKQSDIKIKFYTNYMEKEIYSPFFILDSTSAYIANSNIIDLDIQHSMILSPGSNNNLFTYGFNLRRNFVESSLFSPRDLPDMISHRENLSAIFWQNQMIINDHWAIYYGERYDIHPKTGFLRSPRFSTVVTLPDHSLRLSFSKAFRNPSFFESYVNNGWYRGGYLKGFHNQEFEEEPNHDPENGVLESDIRNNITLTPEKIFSIELGFQRNNRISQYGITYGVDFFYNYLQDFITLLPLDPKDYDEYNLFYFNFGGGAAFGAETNIRFNLKPVSFYANYSYMKIKDINSELKDIKSKVSNVFIQPDSAQEFIEGYFDFDLNKKRVHFSDRTPIHKVNLGFDYHPISSFYVSGNFYWCSKTKNWVQFESSSLQDISSYSYTDLSIGYKWNIFAIAFSVKNLFNQVHCQYPRTAYINKQIMYYYPEIYYNQMVEPIQRLFYLTFKIKY